MQELHVSSRDHYLLVTCGYVYVALNPNKRVRANADFAQSL